MRKINIAILGFGNVGGGTAEILNKNSNLLGCDINIKYIMVRDINKPIPWSISKALLTSDFDEIINDKDVDIVVEVLGGVEPASTYIKRALKAGKHVVTANKAAVAHNFKEFTNLAKENSVEILFEASVGGGIPALTSISKPLVGNRFMSVMGILNGTTNYILSKMHDESSSYAAALKDAQEKGFAEADPTADVEGIDVANKLSILLALCFGVYVNPNDIPTEGITAIDMNKINEAKSIDEKIKLIGYANVKAGKEESAKNLDFNSSLDDIKAVIDFGVKPMTFHKSHPIYTVNNEFNAIYVEGDMVGQCMFYGKGAGPLPTGSAVVGDIVSIAKKL